MAESSPSAAENCSPLHIQANIFADARKFSRKLSAESGQRNHQIKKTGAKIQDYVNECVIMCQRGRISPDDAAMILHEVSQYLSNTLPASTTPIDQQLSHLLIVTGLRKNCVGKYLRSAFSCFGGGVSGAEVASGGGLGLVRFRTGACLRKVIQHDKNEEIVVQDVAVTVTPLRAGGKPSLTSSSSQHHQRRITGSQVVVGQEGESYVSELTGPTTLTGVSGNTADTMISTEF